MMPISRQCAHCGVDFEPMHTRNIYCSVECKIGARKAKKKEGRVVHGLAERVCPYCKTEFLPRRLDQYICTQDACRKARNADNYKAWVSRRTNNPNKCHMPGCDILTQGASGYCSEDHERRHKTALEGAARLREFAGL